MTAVTIPRSVYITNHMDVVAAALKNIFDQRDSISTSLKSIDEVSILRHFAVGLMKI